MKTFTFNGKTSDELGLVIKNMPPVPRAERDITSLAISGKSGNLHIDNKSWKSKRYTIECICKDTTKADLLKSTLWGTHKLTLSTYSDREFIATIKNQIDFDNYLTYLQSFPLELELQPFGYDTTETTTTIGKEYVTGTGENLTLNNTTTASMDVDLKGNTYQETTTGKNILENKTKNSGTSKGITFTLNEDGSYTLNGTNDGTGNSVVYISNSANKTSLTAGRYYTLYTPAGVTITCVKDGGGYQTLASSSYNFFDLSVDTTMQVYIQVVKGVTTTFNNAKVYPMISTTAITESDYEPYTNGASPNPDYPQEVQVVTGDNTIKVSNKNLCPTNTFSLKKDTNRTIQINFPKPIPAGTYTISWKVTNMVDLTSSSICMGWAIYKTNIGSPSTNLRSLPALYSGETRTSYTFALTDTANYIYAYIASNAPDTATITLEDLQIEKGSTATDFTPYQSQEYEINLGTLELCKIGTYQDYIYKSGENWYKHREIGKVVLVGSESWNLQSINSYGIANFYTDAIGSSLAGANFLVYCNNFSKQTSLISVTETEGCLNATSTSFFLRIKSSRASTVADLRTWLGNNNTIVYTPLDTPTEEQITNAELIGQLEETLNAVSYEDQTNISQENDNLPFILDVSALKKGTDRAVINNTGNVEVAPIITVGSQGTLTVNGYSIETTEDNITIDCELMECYNGAIAKNNKVILSEFPVLDVGNNTVVAQTADNITIKHKRGWL